MLVRRDQRPTAVLASEARQEYSCVESKAAVWRVTGASVAASKLLQELKLVGPSMSVQVAGRYRFTDIFRDLSRIP